MDKKMLDRISELSRKKRSIGLTAEEQAEQQELYKVYLSEIRAQFSSTLDNVSVKEKAGKVVPFKEAYAKKDSEEK